MVFQKRLDYGFNGYQVLVIPRAARSARRRRSSAKKVEDTHMCAFDLLASVAGKLLLETEISPISSNTSTEKDNCRTTTAENAMIKEHQDEGKPLKIEPYDQESGDRKLLVPELVLQAHNQNYGSNSKESQYSQTDAHSGLTSVLTTSEFSERHCAEKMKIGGSIGEMIGCKVEVGSSAYMDTGDCKLESEIKILMKDESNNMPIDIRADMCSLENPVAWDGKPAAAASSDSSSKGPLYNEHLPFPSYNRRRVDVNVVSRDDDDENSSRYTQPIPKTRFFRPSPHIGGRRIRKLLASRYWKVAPKLKDEKLQNTVFPDGGMKLVYRNRKNCYKHQIYKRNYPFKKRKIYYHSSISNLNGATGTTSSVPSYQSRDSHVKLKIQSFIVPEVFIEIPETETVGSLKRTVMEAVNAILGGGLHVGMLLHGKKIRDDHKTLQQTGISRDKHPEAIGFTLDPTLSQGSPCLGPEDPLLLPSDTPQCVTRYPPESALVRKGNIDISSELHDANLGNFDESDHDSGPSSIDSLINKNTADSKALVASPAMSVGALAMVPPHQKSKRSEIAQRRIRRPFSVTEVEALVQAVEKLGTGRWRDVKLRAFGNAKHRTYVDLKDKWKTLVHTARISPQQRRGEPVPQELLDRVLAAHAYWSLHHAKLRSFLGQTNN